MSASRIGRFVRFLQNEVCKFAEGKLIKPNFTAAPSLTKNKIMPQFPQGVFVSALFVLGGS